MPVDNVEVNTEPTFGISVMVYNIGGGTYSADTAIAVPFLKVVRLIS